MNITNFFTILSKFESTIGNGSKLLITQDLKELFLKLEGDEYFPVIYFLQCRVAPKFVPIEFNYSSKQIIKALSEIDQCSLDLNAKYLEFGDIGTLVEYVLSQNKYALESSLLNIVEVFDLLYKFATISGKNSQKFKQELLIEIFKSLDVNSSKFISRIIEGNIRINFSDKTILDAISLIISNDKSVKDLLERAYGVRSDLGYLLKYVMENKDTDIMQKLENMSITPFTPVASKLVERESTLSDIWVRMPDMMVQPKFDGMRCQVHLSGDIVRLYSRNMEEMTESFPDVVVDILQFANNNNITSMILDSEVIGYDTSTGLYVNFQETVQRKRKHGVEEKADKTPVIIDVFDILYLNDVDMTRNILEDRITKLRSFTYSDKIKLTDTTNVKDIDQLELLFNSYVNEGLEGIITKKFGTYYDPGTRNYDWIKFKRSTDAKLNDSIDGVVLGYYKGQGKRTEFGMGGILVGLYDKVNDTYVSICKVGTGFSDEQFKSYFKDLENIKLKLKPTNYEISKILEPDIYVKPDIVVEIEADEITVSTNHTAGYSLRFPRIKVWRRDKKAEQSTTIDEVKSMFEKRRK